MPAPRTSESAAGRQARVPARRLLPDPRPAPPPAATGSGNELWRSGPIRTGPSTPRPHADEGPHHQRNARPMKAATNTNSIVRPLFSFLIMRALLRAAIADRPVTAIL